MAGHGAPEQRPLDCHDLRVAVVAASWHDRVMDGLLDGARRALKDYRVEEPQVVRVPGTFELAVAARVFPLLEEGSRYLDVSVPERPVASRYLKS